MKSISGETWRQYYESDELSWCTPKKMNAVQMQRHIDSEWIQKIIALTGMKPGPAFRILEAGCGTGLYSLCMAVLGFQVCAFDYNENALIFAHALEKTARELNPHLQVEFGQGDLMAISANENTFDMTFNQAVLEYFTDDAESRLALSEMVRVTRPGGWVVAIVQHTGHPFYSMWRNLGWQGYTNQPPVRQFTPEILMEYFRQAGLVNIRVDGILPWKALFFYPRWYQKIRWMAELVYLVGRFLDRFVPLPLFFRQKMALQVIVTGQKNNQA